LNSEISMMVRSRSFVAQMRAVEMCYRDISVRLTAQKWREEPMKATVLDGLARLTSALQ
jgi:cardiolipin synthase A/B